MTLLDLCCLSRIPKRYCDCLRHVWITERGEAGCQELKEALRFRWVPFQQLHRRGVPYSWESDLSALSPLSSTCNDLLVTEHWVAGWCGRVCAQGNTWLPHLQPLSFTSNSGQTGQKHSHTHTQEQTLQNTVSVPYSRTLNQETIRRLLCLVVLRQLVTMCFRGLKSYSHSSVPILAWELMSRVFLKKEIFPNSWRNPKVLLTNFCS